MLTIEIPDFATLRLEHLVLDYNGTLAEDGAMLEGVRERLERLSPALRIHVVTGDTFGSARASLQGLPCELAILAATGQSQAKLDYVRRLSAESVACIGNGRNDRLMMQACALGIAVIQAEGTSAHTLAAADAVAPSIRDALDLLLEPRRLVATLRG